MSLITIGINLDFFRGRHQIGKEYVDGVIAAGGFPLLVPCCENRELLERYLEMADGFLFIGGLDYPAHYYGRRPHRRARLMDQRRAAADLYLAQAAWRRRRPILGICGGHQLLNIALGGKLVQHVPPGAGHGGGRKHQVEIKGGKILRGLFGRGKIMVNSYHHQAVTPAVLAAGLAGVAFDRRGMIEAFESIRHPFVLGLQWHPERMPWKTHGAKIFRALVRAARKGAR